MMVEHFFAIAGVGGILYFLYRIIFPFRCECGHIHWTCNAMLHHVEMKHSHRHRVRR